MTPRTHSRRDYLNLKAKSRELTRQVGGLDHAAGLTRPGRSAISDYGNINYPDMYMPADVIADLEAEAGEPTVTRALARLQGYELLQVEFGGDVDPAWAMSLAGIGKEVAEFFGKSQIALANGGDIDAGEIRTLDLITECDEAITALMKIRSALTARQDGTV